MASVSLPDRAGIALPEDLSRRLHAFRRLVWLVKSIEAICGGLFGFLLGYLFVFVLDRLTETPQWLRLAAFAAAVAACSAVPLAFHRWIWNHRGLDQVARLIARRFPSMGDQLLGIIEIVREFSVEADRDGEQTRSRALCEAAIGQVAEQSAKYDFSIAVPHARHRLWAVLAAVPVAAAVLAATLVPAAATNAWARFLAPWKAVERYTFTRIEKLPAEMVVPHGEAAPLVVGLGKDTQWQPDTASVRIGRQKPLAASLTDDSYAFTLPPQLAESQLALAVGDVRQRTTITPMFRPEIATLVADVKLPEYLRRPDPLRQDVRGGVLAPVKGSTVAVTATANRELAAAAVDGVAVTPDGATVKTAPLTTAEEVKVAIEWEDRHGLKGAKPLVFVVSPRDDEAPTVNTLDMPANRDILLSSDTLRFKIAVRDDFGIRRVGIEWEAATDDTGSAPDKGDRLLQAGGPTEESLEVAATFCPDALGIRPQPLVLRAFAEDYLPGRGRAYSMPQLIYVVDRAEHALIMNEKLNRWRGQANEIRDREMSLLRENIDLRSLPAEKLLDAETQRRIEQQAAAEEAQAQRMDRLVDEGERLVREAMKNPEFEPQTLENLAEDLQTLGEIGDSRMPNVSDLLRQAARAQMASARQGEPSESGESGPQSPKVVTDKDDQGDEGGGKGGEPPQGQTPQVVDKESSQQPKDPNAKPQEGGGGGGQGRLGLPSTQAGVAPPSDGGDGAAGEEEEPPADELLADAIEAQQKLLEEFAKVADDLAAVMANLEGSTFVKRLKLASREQGSIAEKLAVMSAETFGKAEKKPAPVQKAMGAVAEVNTRETEKVSNLMDDMQAYFDRRQLPAFRTVLEDLKGLDTLGSLRALSDDIEKESGMSIAQAEFWSDTFDRLADDLVPPPQGGGGGGGGGGGETPPSVPPEVVLEAMQILEAEMNLREETRVGEQTKKGIAAEEHAALGRKLGEAQNKLADRIVRLVDRLLEEENGERAYGREIQLFEKVDEVMSEAADMLRTPDTGPKPIAAETEVIELLLATQSAGGGGGGAGGGAGGAGGGGTSPGGGGTGTTSALAEVLAGRGNTTKGGSENVEKGQGTGQSGRVLPNEFRAGLDAYFNKFEKERR